MKTEIKLILHSNCQSYRLHLNSYYCVLNSDIHHKVFIYVYLQFKSELKENYLASTSLYRALINHAIFTHVGAKQEFLF